MAEFNPLAGLIASLNPEVQAETQIQDLISQIANVSGQPQVVQPRPLSTGQQVGTTIADALSAYAAGINPNVRPTNFRQQAIAQRQADADRQTAAGEQARKEKERTRIAQLQTRLEELREKRERGIADRKEMAELRRREREKSEAASKALSQKQEDITTGLLTYGLDTEDYNLADPYGRSRALADITVAMAEEEDARKEKKIPASVADRASRAAQGLGESMIDQYNQLLSDPALLANHPDPARVREDFYRKMNLGIGPGFPELKQQLTDAFEETLGRSIDVEIQRRESSGQAEFEQFLEGDIKKTRKSLQTGEIIRDIVRGR